MTDTHAYTLPVGEDSRSIAVIARPGGNPGLFWLGGFRSNMVGTKALALDNFAATHGLAATRFDYSGHGQSGGAFLDGTISRWLEEALAVFATTSGPQVVVGSSMGGWLALLLARRLRQRGETGRLAGLVLIAPAVDMTKELMLAGFTTTELQSLVDQGFVAQPSQYSDQPYVITKALLDDGGQHLLFGGAIEAGCPIHILQGGQDPDVPQAHALRLVSHLLTDPVVVTLIPDGDHRLSRPQDIARLEAAIAGLIA